LSHSINPRIFFCNLFIEKLFITTTTQWFVVFTDFVQPPPLILEHSKQKLLSVEISYSSLSQFHGNHLIFCLGRFAYSWHFK
jgi:hypothetical protein